jgi:hypothetical protein
MRSRARALQTLLALAAFGAATFSAPLGNAFPGVAVSVTPTPPKISTTELVVMEHAGVSIVTLAVDYQGPIQRFALLLPVPRDVERKQLRTVKHEFIARLEQMTAPRVFEFWERDPCSPGEPEQAWEEKVKVKNRGFLTPDVMPPRDDHYPVSNELSIPALPVFKEAEAEFSYQLLRPKSSSELRAWLEKKNYRVDPGVLEPLLDVLGGEAQLLVAEVAVDRAELVDGERLRLGGIRYWSRRPLLPVFMTLGRANRAARHDLFVYALHRDKRYLAANVPNVFAPTNLRVTVDVGARVGPLYNTLLERVLQKQPGAAVSEFVGPSDACGEPCSNAPLELRELLTFGGDVLELQTPAKHEANPPARERLESDRPALAAPRGTASASAVPAPNAEQRALEKQLRAKRALLARQRYVVSRLHLRTGAATPQVDLQLAATDTHHEGGYGVPRGPNAELASGIRPAATSRYQVRFHGVHPWQGALPCAKPERWRWGKRWRSHTQHWRGVDVARDLPRLGQDPKLLDAVLLSPVPEIGFSPRAPSAPAPPASAPAPDPDRGAPDASTCGLGRPGTNVSGCLGLVVVVAALGRWRRRSVRIRTRAQPRG